MLKHNIFLPLNCLKSFILIGSILTIIVGVLSTIMVIYIFLMSTMWLQFSKSLRNVLIISFLVATNLIILTGVSGLYGVVRRKNIFLSVYCLSILIYIIGFIALGLFATLYPYHVLESCNSQNSIQIQNLFNKANQTLCKSCECYFNNYQDYNSTQKIILSGILLKSSTLDTSLPVNASSCPEWGQDSSMTSQLYLMQSFFSCSGWCQTNVSYNLVYYFTDINNGIPQGFCFDLLTSFFKKFGFMLKLSSFSVSGSLAIVFLTLICLCCHPQRDRSRDSSFQPKLIDEQQ